MDVCLIPVPVPATVVLTTITSIDPVFMGGVMCATSVATIAVMKAYERSVVKTKEKRD